MSLYAEKDALIKKINAEEKNFTVGHNFMSTMTDFEYKKMLGYKAAAGDATPQLLNWKSPTMTESTGEPKVLLTQLWTKVNVVPAGLSLLCY